ncbi:MAG: hypothetical protein Q7S79_03415 [bacterium]|nr:hypothetical protein [bacterium]
MAERERSWVDDLLAEALEEDKARKAYVAEAGNSIYVPKVGDYIYVPTFEYMGGEGEVTSIVGGKAEILRINKDCEPESDYYTCVIRVKGLDFIGFSWDKLGEMQGELQKEFGDSRARMRR